MAWLSGWSKRVKLTIDQNDIDAVLSNFPILVYLSVASGRNDDDVTFVFDELQSNNNRLKIAVTTDDGVTQCYVEVEKWDDNEQAWLWVKVPSIASDADTDLYLYYDITHADNVDYVGDPNSEVAENVWDANFVFVSHMRDDPDTSHIRDSSTNDNDGTKAGDADPAVTTSGKIDDAQTFNGTSSKVDLGNGVTSLITENYTAEVWIKPTALTSTRAASLSWSFMELGKNLAKVYFQQAYDSSWTKGYQYTSPTNLLDTSLWSHIVGVFTKDVGVDLYVGGDYIGSDTTKTGTTLNISGITYIGQWYQASPGGAWFDGIADEIRISNIVRPAAWIKATYQTEIDDLLDFGSEEEVAAIVGPFPTFFRL